VFRLSLMPETTLSSDAGRDAWWHGADIATTLRKWSIQTRLAACFGKALAITDNGRAPGVGD
jgi:hypothetical protein